MSNEFEEKHHHFGSVPHSVCRFSMYIPSSSIKLSRAPEMLRKLDSKNLVIYRKYGGATLTEEGRKIGEMVRGMQKVIRLFVLFLKKLGIP